jgi:Domain of unknown function (DUF1707)
MNASPASTPAGDLRVSDAERDAVVAELSEHFQAGRLNSTELDERIGKALTARTGRELAALTVDLPALPGHGQAAPQPAAPRLLAGGALRLAIALAVIGVIVTSLAFPAHVRGGNFPWWLILFGFPLCRRLVRAATAVPGETAPCDPAPAYLAAAKGAASASGSLR